MKRKLLIVGCLLLLLGLVHIHTIQAAFPDSLSNVAARDTITSASWNNLEGALGTLTSTSTNSVNYLLRNTSTPLGQIRALTPSTGTILYYNNGIWNALSAGSNGQLLNLSAGLPAWTSATNPTINDLQNASFTIAGTSGQVTVVSSSPNVITVSIPNPLVQNVSSTALTFTNATGSGNLHVGSFALTNVTGSIPYATSTGQFSALSIGPGLALSNGSLSATGVLSANSITGAAIWAAAGPGLSVASSGQTITYTYSSSTLNLGSLSVENSPLAVAKGGTATTTAPTDSQVLSANGSNPAWRNLSAGSNITITTSTTAITIAATGGAGGNASGTTGNVQFYDGGAFGADSTFTYAKTTKKLNLSSDTSSFAVADVNANFYSPPGASTSTTFSYTGATSSWTVPAGVTSITLNVQGAVGGWPGTCGGTAGSGGSATGTLAVTPGTTYYYAVGGSSNSNAGGWPGGGDGGSQCPGGGMSWFSPSSSFSTSSVLIVGASGGGQGSGGTTGGNGGGLTGTAGANGTGTGGAGGTQTAGGASGGAAGQGGAGGANTGGGGAGYFGGGGGQSGTAAGGGGSSFLHSSLTTTSTASGANNSTGTIKITYNVPSSSSNASSTYGLAVGGHVITGYPNGAVLTVSSCGSSPTIVGNDTAGIVTAGSGAVTSCTVTFGASYYNRPACVATNQSSTLAMVALTSTSSLTLKATSSFASDPISYICLGY